MIVIGRVNDVMLYRELVRRGVSDYVIAPGRGDRRRALDLQPVLGRRKPKPSAASLPSSAPRAASAPSTVAHNVAWAIARDLALDSVVADLDLAFGTAGLDYNQDPPQGIADAVFSPDQVDTAFIDRLLSKCTDHLSLLAAPATLDQVYDFGAEAFDSIFDTLRTTMPLHRARRSPSMVGVDQARADRRRRHPDRRRARSRQSAQHQEHVRPAEGRRGPTTAPPLYCLNQVGVPKRPEIGAASSPRRSKASRSRTIPFEPQMFGTAANNGQMIAEIAASHRATEMFLQIAQRLTGRGEAEEAELVRC